MIESFSPDFLADLESVVVSREGRTIANGEIRFRCPSGSHEDRNPSARWNMSKQVWRCDSCGKGGGALDLADLLGIARPSRPTAPLERRVVRTYGYTDEAGALLFEVIRYEPKSFVQRRPDGQGGWDYKLEGVRRVLFRLPDALAMAHAARAHPEDSSWRVWVVEGEKDVEAVESLGLVATCNAGGAGKFRPEYADVLAGAPVIVFADKDTPGRKHAEQVARALYGKARSVKVIEAPGTYKDAAEWIVAGGTRADLDALADAAPEWTPPSSHRGISLSAREFVMRDIPPLEWLVERILPRHAVAFIAGAPKSFKSFLCLDLAFAVASGNNFLGEYVAPAPQRVLIVQLESSAAAFKKRLESVASRFGQIPADLRVISNTALVLEDESSVEKIEAELAEYRPALLILDPLASLTQADENSAQEMGNLVRLFRGWRDRYGCTVLVVHHTGKAGEKPTSRRSGERMRGSSALHGASEAAIYVERPSDDMPRVHVSVELKETEAPRAFVCEFQPDNGSALVIVGDAPREPTDEDIKTYIRSVAGGWATTADVAREFGKKEDTMRSRLKTMRGLLLKPGSGSARVAAEWGVAPSAVPEDIPA